MTTSGWSSQYRTPESSQERADNFSSREQQEIRERMGNLSSSVVDWRIWTLWTRTDLTITQTWLENEQSLHTLEWYLTTLDNLLQIIKDAKKWITKRWLSKAQKENMRVAKIKLNQYEKALKRKRRIILKQRWVEISQNDIHTLQDIREQTAKVKESMKSDTISDDGAYLYSSPEIARKSNRSKDKQIIFNQWFQGVLEDGAVKEIWNGNIEAVNDFFMRVAEWRYTQADYIKYTQNAWILNPHFERCGINVPLAAPSQLPSGRQYQIEQRSVGSVDYSNMDWWETFERGWISWIIDKWLSFCKNMTPWQRNTWKNIGVLWWFAAWIFWLYKFFTNKNMSLLSKAWITAWTIFASQALTWDNPITLFRKLMTWWFSVDELKTTFWNAFWDAVSWVWNSWIESLSSVAPAMYSAMIFNPWTTIWEVQAMTDRFRVNGDEWKTFRRQAVIKLEDNYGQRSAEYFSATFWDNFDEEKWRNWLWSFWVTDWSRTWDVIERYITNAWINSQILNKYLEDNWLKIKEDEVIKEEINEYIREKNENKETIDVDELEAHKEEWFTTNGESQTTQQSESSETQTNQPSQSTETQTSPSNNNTNPQNPESNNEWVKINESQLKPWVEVWLKKSIKDILGSFNRMTRKVLWGLWVDESLASKYTDSITSVLVQNVCEINWKDVVLNLSDDKIKLIYDNFIDDLWKSYPKYEKTIKKYNRDWVVSELKEEKEKAQKKGKRDDYNTRKNRILSFVTLFDNVNSSLKKQWFNTKIVSNWQDCSTVKVAFDNLNILK